MKDKNAFFLLQAIGELSEETVAEAKRIRRFSMRRILIAAAVLSAFIFATALTVGIMNVSKEPDQMMNYDNKSSRHQDKPSTPDQTGETVTPPPTEPPTEAPTEAAEYDGHDNTEITDVSADSSQEDDQNGSGDSVSGDYLSGAIRFERETVGDVCEVGGLLYSAYWCDSGWRDYHTVALITSQAQLNQFFLDFTGDTLKGYGFSHYGEEYDWDYYGMIAVANTREDNIALDLIELRRDESSASFYPYFRESAVISNEPLDNITDIKLYRIRLSDCEGIRGFYL